MLITDEKVKNPQETPPRGAVLLSKTPESKKLDPKYFGEGCDIINNKVYQLTYKERKM